MPELLGVPAEIWLLKTVAPGKVPAAAAVGKTPVVPGVHLTAAAHRSQVVLELVELEAVAGTPVAAVAEAVGSAAVVAEQTTILVVLMPVAEEAGLHMRTRHS
jgi:hypothetical protein